MQNNNLTNNKLMLARQSGVTMIEYALIAALISVAAITMLTPIGDAILAKLTVVKVAIVGS
jgi:Flp pilus assembly pilin Flp